MDFDGLVVNMQYAVLSLESGEMAAALVRPSILLVPTFSARLHSELRRLRVGSSVLRAPSCSLHTVVAAEDPVSLPFPHSFLSVCTVWVVDTAVDKITVWSFETRVVIIFLLLESIFASEKSRLSWRAESRAEW